MMERHEEKYLLTYRQYVLLKEKAAALLTPDSHGKNGSYTVTSLYYDDPIDTALLEKQDGLPRHTKFRLRTYDHCGDLIRLEKKVKEGVLTQKQTATVTVEQIEKLGRDNTGFSEEIYPLALEMQSKGVRPAIGVQYKRDAYLFPGTDLRLTFDYDLRVLPAEEQVLFTKELPGVPVLEGNAVIMEIKYGGYLPNFVRYFTALVESQLSVSKYALCREKMM